MSLIGWWKLDGDLLDSSGRGQHGSATTVSTVSGKINDAYDHNTSTAATFNFAKPLNKYKFSLSYWIRPTGIPSSDYRIVWEFRDESNVRYYNGDTRTVADPYILHYVKDYNIASWSSTNVLPNSLFTQNGWHHLVLAVDGLTRYSYRDGVFLGSSTVTQDLEPYGNLASFILNTTNPNVVEVDDVKVYDHTLSHKEVKELAQAKVVHWKFDDFQEPTTNLNNTDISTWTTRSGVTVSETTAVAPPIPGAKVYLATKTLDSSLLRDGNTVTGPLSPNSAIDHTFSVYVRSTPNTVSTSFGIDIGDGASASVTLSNEWQRVVATGTGNNTNGTRDFTDLNVYGLTGDEVYLSCVQTERKENATPFVDGSRTGVLNDSSGYLAPIPIGDTSTPHWVDSGTAIGQGAYEFYDEDFISIGDLQDPQVFSVSFWVNPYELDDTAGNDYRIILYGGSAGNFILIEQNGSVSFRVPGVDATNYTAGNCPLNTWTHVVCTYDQDYRRIYVNGSLAGEQQIGSGTVALGVLQLGHTGQDFVGKLDDFRIYHTALSADDISELHQQRASLDNRGNLHSHSLAEFDALYYRWFTTDGSNPATKSGFDALFAGDPAGEGVHTGNVDWSNVSSRPTYITPTTNFAWEVTGRLYCPYTGNYDFNTQSDDGCELQIDGQVVAFFYGGRGIGAGDFSGPIKLSEGYHDFQFRMQQGAGGAAGRVLWQKLGDSTYTPIPSENFMSLTEPPNSIRITDNVGITYARRMSEVGPTKDMSIWLLGENSGSDISGNQNDATLTGATTSAGEGREISFHLDAKSDYISIPQQSDTQMSACLWYFFETSATWNTILCRDGGTYHHVLVQTGTNNIGFYNAAWYSSGFALTPNTWHHIAVVKDGTNSKLYVDGDLKQDSNSSFDNSTAPLELIGNHNTSSPTQGALGRINDFRFYNRLLSSEEIGVLYDITAPSGTMMKQTQDSVYVRGKFDEVSL